MNYRVEDALRRAKELPPRYFVLGGVFALLLIVGMLVWWPEPGPTIDPTTEAALTVLKSDQDANQPPPPETSVPSTPRRQAVPAK